ncbi:hypothetical protein [Draconibacterium orientale]|uniref:hypothetical protein n=1 Tax=Draconibacterium orientale TaxID=1168034 RepID=UPI002ABE99A4|nr:hypothetical protein [Draconibacterium orientale]
MSVLSYGKFRIYFVLIFMYFLLHFAITYLFNTLNIYIQTFHDQLSISRIEKLFSLSSEQQWINYIILPIIIFLRTFYTSIFLYIGISLTQLEINFSKLFKIALLADFVFVISTIAKLIILIFFKDVYTLNDLQFIPLSILEILDNNRIDQVFIYPLSMLNVFEVSYFFVLAWLLHTILKEENEKLSIKFGQSLKLVAASYGSGLLLWVLVVMFITLNLT